MLGWGRCDFPRANIPLTEKLDADWVRMISNAAVFLVALENAFTAPLATFDAHLCPDSRPLKA